MLKQKTVLLQKISVVTLSSNKSRSDIKKLKLRVKNDVLKKNSRDEQCMQRYVACDIYTF